MASKIVKLKDWHHRVIDLALAGRSQKSICEELGICQSHMSRVMTSVVFQDEMARRRKFVDEQVVKANVSTVDKAKEALDSAAYDAAQVHVKALKSKNISVRQRSADSILGNTLKKVDDSVPNYNISVENINLLNQVVQEVMDGDRSGKFISSQKIGE